MKKTDLYRSLWDSCDELRGSMDASQYKNYILVLLFMKYVTDRYGNDQQALLDVPEGGSFNDLVALKGDKNIGEGMNKVIAKFAEANELQGVIDTADADWNNPDKLGRGKEMVDKLSKLIAIFENPALDFSANRQDGDDLLGDAYEYLMRHFATQSGKAKGQFYTPAEVSRILATVVGANTATSAQQTIYDPTCGSGSLLLKAHDLAVRHAGHDLAIYGQEKDQSTANLAKMNMVLHEAPHAEIAQGDTLATPEWSENSQLKRHDFVVANPPFSTKSWSSGFDPHHDTYSRFEYGVPPDKNGDYAFLLHILASLKSTGTAAVILPHGVLFRGNAEAHIRTNLIQRGYIKAIIGLPPNLFFGTGIAACIVILDKANAAARDSVFMIDASSGYAKDGAKNRLRERDIHRILDTYTTQTDIDRYSRLVPIIEVEANGYNLNLPRYIDTSEPEDIHDLDAHMNGGIPQADIDALNDSWDHLPTLADTLFRPLRPGYVQLAVPADQIGETIRALSDYDMFEKAVTEAFEQWRQDIEPLLRSVDPSTRPDEVIKTASESLLAAFRDVPLVDEYGIYQRFTEYADSTLRDDLYLITELGWRAAAQPTIMPKKQQGEKNRPDPDFTEKVGNARTDYAAGALPAANLTAKTLADEQRALDTANADVERIEGQVTELESAHEDADGAFSEVLGVKGLPTKTNVTARLRQLPDTDEDERPVLEQWLALTNELADAKKALKDATTTLIDALKSTYDNLDDPSARDLIVAGWLTAVADAIQDEASATVHTLQTRLEILRARYTHPLPTLTSRTLNLRHRVEHHLGTIQSTP